MFTRSSKLKCAFQHWFSLGSSLGFSLGFSLGSSLGLPAPVFLSAFFLLAGCNAGGDGLVSAPNHQPNVNLGMAGVAFVSLEGPPEPLSQHLLDAIKTQAAAQNIGQAQDFQAHYLLRGYVTAYAQADGVALATVWDVFNAGKERIKRLDNNFIARGAKGDVWAVLDEAGVERLSAQMVGDVEDYLRLEAKNPNAPFSVPTAEAGSNGLH